MQTQGGSEPCRVAAKLLSWPPVWNPHPNPVSTSMWSTWNREPSGDCLWDRYPTRWSPDSLPAAMEISMPSPTTGRPEPWCRSRSRAVGSDRCSRSPLERTGSIAVPMGLSTWTRWAVLPTSYAFRRMARVGKYWPRFPGSVGIALGCYPTDGPWRTCPSTGRTG
jgi:hypothetical protein